MHGSKRVLALLVAGGLGLLGCGGESGDQADIGRPGDKAKASRVLEVQMTDKPRYVPEFLNVTPSETVTIRVTNKGTKIHEFVLGNTDDQDERAELMKNMGAAPMNMADKANAVTVDPGATEEITWSFPGTGTVLFGCHQPGDYENGMKGQVKISA